MGMILTYGWEENSISVKEKTKEPMFGGAFYDKYDNLIYINRVIYNQPYTIVLWSDGSKTIAKCREDDTYNKEFGLSIAVMKKVCGSMFVKRLYEDWLPNGDIKVINLSDVRKAHNKK